MHLLKGESYDLILKWRKKTINKVNMKIRYIIEKCKGGKKTKGNEKWGAGTRIKFLDRAAKKILTGKDKF